MGSSTMCLFGDEVQASISLPNVPKSMNLDLSGRRFYFREGSMSRLLCWAVPNVPKILVIRQINVPPSQRKMEKLHRSTTLLINSSTNKYPPFYVPDMNIEDKTKYSPIGQDKQNQIPNVFPHQVRQSIFSPQFIGSLAS